MNEKEKTLFILGLDDKDFNDLYNSTYNMQLSKGTNIGFRKGEPGGRPGKMEKLMQYTTDEQFERLRIKLEIRAGRLSPKEKKVPHVSNYDRAEAAKKGHQTRKQLKEATKTKPIEPQISPATVEASNGQYFHVPVAPVEPQPIRMVSKEEQKVISGLKVSSHIYTQFVIEIPPIEILLKGEYANNMKLISEIAEQVTWVVQEAVKQYADKIYG